MKKTDRDNSKREREIGKGKTKRFSLEKES
jgi:hypothetical protein